MSVGCPTQPRLIKCAGHQLRWPRANQMANRRRQLRRPTLCARTSRPFARHPITLCRDRRRAIWPAPFGGFVILAIEVYSMNDMAVPSDQIGTVGPLRVHLLGFGERRGKRRIPTGCGLQLTDLHFQLFAL